MVIGILALLLEIRDVDKRQLKVARETWIAPSGNVVLEVDAGRGKPLRYGKLERWFGLGSCFGCGTDA
jgi:hypothetical protein